MPLPQIKDLCSINLYGPPSPDAPVRFLTLFDTFPLYFDTYLTHFPNNEVPVGDITIVGLLLAFSLITWLLLEALNKLVEQ